MARAELQILLFLFEVQWKPPFTTGCSGRLLVSDASLERHGSPKTGEILAVLLSGVPAAQQYLDRSSVLGHLRELQGIVPPGKTSEVRETRVFLLHIVHIRFVQFLRMGGVPLESPSPCALRRVRFLT